MSKTFKDLPERIKAKMQDKGTEALKTALPKNTDESFTHEDTFIFKSADVNEIQAFKDFIEESESKLISSEEFYGYVLEEKELTEREQSLDSDNFPFLKKLQAVAPYDKLQKGYTEKWQAQDAFNEAQEEIFKKSRKITGPDLFTSITARFEVRDVLYKETSEDELYELPDFMKDKKESTEKVYRKDSSSERRAIHQELSEMAKKAEVEDLEKTD